MASTSRTTEQPRAGCSKRLSSKAAASEEARRTLRYVEPLNDARTMLADFFNILRLQPPVSGLWSNERSCLFLRWPSPVFHQEMRGRTARPSRQHPALSR